MTDPVQERPLKEAPGFAEKAGANARRKLKARRDADHGVWFGLGMMGLVGWSVAAPTLLGAALGLWLDGRQPGPRSWTLALMMAGLVVGCLNAWHWVAKQEQTMRDEQDEQDTPEADDE
jgi:ATP synthase protein I